MSAPPQMDEALLDAALDCFARFGYERTRMADIAAAAGLSRPALYLRVRNKEELGIAVSRRAHDVSLQAARAAAAAPAVPAERVRGVLRAKLDLTLDLAGRSAHALELISANRRVAGAITSDYEATLQRLITGVLVEVGLASRRRAGEVSAMLIRAVAGLEQELDSPRRARTLLDLLVELTVAGLATAAPDGKPP
jgi:TetR/AcrR family transcriptional regulator